MSNIRITAFKWAPPFAQGLVRDLRVRWALEEAGLRYEENLLTFGDQNLPEYRAVQPFGQVPVYQEDGLTLFESGAIVMHIAEEGPGLEDLAGLLRLGGADRGGLLVRLARDTGLAPCEIECDHLVARIGEPGHRPAAAGLGVVGVSTNNNDLLLAS